MKKYWYILFVAIVLAVAPYPGFAQGFSDESNHPYAFAEPPFEGSYVHLQVDGGYVRLFIPIGYHLQAYELSDVEACPFIYVFLNEDTHAQFVVYSSLDNEKNQGILLRKLYDPSNHFILFEDVWIGEHPYLVYTKQQSACDYSFLLRTDSGYSYCFQYILPYTKQASSK